MLILEDLKDSGIEISDCSIRLSLIVVSLAECIVCQVDLIENHDETIHRRGKAPYPPDLIHIELPALLVPLELVVGIGQDDEDSSIGDRLNDPVDVGRKVTLRIIRTMVVLSGRLEDLTDRMTVIRYLHEHKADHIGTGGGFIGGDHGVEVVTHLLVSTIRRAESPDGSDGIPLILEPASQTYQHHRLTGRRRTDEEHNGSTPVRYLYTYL